VRAREETFNCIAKKSEIKRALISHQPLIVLMYKEALLCNNDLVSALPSDIVSLLQENWQHYLWPKEFVIHTNHESLKHLKG
jgi:hypothetical protein